jgi:hypothetical protein
MTGSGDAQTRDARPAGILGKRAVPDPAAHARVLIDQYGSSQALQIARVNTSCASVRNYWAAVLGSIVQAAS